MSKSIARFLMVGGTEEAWKNVSFIWNIIAMLRRYERRLSQLTFMQVYTANGRGEQRFFVQSGPLK